MAVTHLVIFTLSLLSVVLYSQSCTYDQIQVRKSELPRIKAHYQTTSSRRVRRTVDDYSAIRIHIYYHNDTDLLPQEVNKLVAIVQQAVAKISSLLSVIPVIGPLQLKRQDACAGFYTRGPNLHKCNRLKKNYAGEFCSNEVDRFQIPDNHLLGQKIYSPNSAVPLVSSIPDGAGVINADYILYVSARLSNWCSQQNLIAYASYCQLDQSSRPVAGFVNFCPAYFSENKFSISKAKMTAIHELFHALGFSRDLFSEFKDCQNIANTRECYPLNVFDRDEKTRTTRIVSPTVNMEASRHFGCNEEIGVPLEHTDYGLSSHWDPLVMHGSVMAPAFIQPEKISIDRITLALFADTGWYRVNISAADTYPWAKDAGCDFLLSSHCGSYDFLCNISAKNELGCVPSASGLVQCLPVSDRHTCGIKKQNESVCCSSGQQCLYQNNISIPSPAPILNLVLSDEVKQANVSKFSFLLSWSKAEDVEKLGLIKQDLLPLLTEYIREEADIPRTWVDASFMNITNGSYIFYLWLKPDGNVTEDDVRGVTQKLHHLTLNFTLDDFNITALGNSAYPDQHLPFFFNGWQAFVVLFLVFFGCFLLALIIMTCISLKIGLWHLNS